VHELDQRTGGPHDVEGGESGAHQLAGRLGGPVQHRGERQVAGHQLVGAQQTPEPALGAEHLLRPVDQLGQQLVEFQPGQVREGQGHGVVLAPRRRKAGVIALCHVDPIPQSPSPLRAQRRPAEHRPTARPVTIT
jgi:hypothetical protein